MIGLNLYIKMIKNDKKDDKKDDTILKQSSMIGLNLWDEFDRVRVLDFLRQLYSQNRLLQQVLEKLSMCVDCF